MCAWMIDEFGNQTQRKTYVPSLCSMEVKSDLKSAGLSLLSLFFPPPLSTCPPTASQSLEQAVMLPAWKLRHNEMETGTASMVQRSAFHIGTLVGNVNVFFECYVGLYQWCWRNRCVPHHGTHWGTRFETYMYIPIISTYTTCLEVAGYSLP